MSLHSERVEYVVCRDVRKGFVLETQYHTEGAQSVFSKSTAETIARRLGDPWEARLYERPDAATQTDS